LRFALLATNNGEEHEAIVARLEIGDTLEAKIVKAFSDSQLVISQTKGRTLLCGTRNKSS